MLGSAMILGLTMCGDATLLKAKANCSRLSPRTESSSQSSLGTVYRLMQALGIESSSG